jgi:hypothetical protein
LQQFETIWRLFPSFVLVESRQELLANSRRGSASTGSWHREAR